MTYFYLFFILTLSMACSNQNDTSSPPDLDESGLEVILKSDKKSYETNEKIVVTVMNQLGQSITAMNQQTFCSIILLEKQEGNDWQEVRNCTLNAPAIEVTIKADSHETIEFIPSQQTTESLSAGTYRATLTYTIGEKFMPAENQTAFSEIFTVR